jgi:hypothetical protein
VAIFGEIRASKYANGYMRNVLSGPPAGVGDKLITQGGHDLLRVNDGDTMDGAIGGPGWDTCVVDASIEAADTCETVIYR